MIKVNITDMETSKDVFSNAELRQALLIRYNNGVNSFEIVPIGQDVPHLTVIIKQDVGTLHYIESFEKAGFVPDNPENNLDPSGFTTLYYGMPSSIHKTSNRQIVAASDALRAAEEFAATQALPTSLRWIEL
jgi:hypothetical protein